MIHLLRKWWLVAALMLSLVAPMAADKGGRNKGCDQHRRDCQQVPEGGSAAIYLLGAGAICLGAILVRSRKPRLS